MVGRDRSGRALVAELARVRTDPNALEYPVNGLLIAQGYFPTDLYVKLVMLEILKNAWGAASGGFPALYWIRSNRLSSVHGMR